MAPSPRPDAPPDPAVRQRRDHRHPAAKPERPARPRERVPSLRARWRSEPAPTMSRRPPHWSRPWRPRGPSGPCRPIAWTTMSAHRRRTPRRTRTRRMRFGRVASPQPGCRGGPDQAIGGHPPPAMSESPQAAVSARCAVEASHYAVLVLRTLSPLQHSRSSRARQVLTGISRSSTSRPTIPRSPLRGPWPVCCHTGDPSEPLPAEIGT